MNFEFSKAQLTLQNSMAAFAREAIPPCVAELESGEFPAGLWERYREAGLLWRQPDGFRRV